MMPIKLGQSVEWGRNAQGSVIAMEEMTWTCHLLRLAKELNSLKDGALTAHGHHARSAEQCSRKI
jgi:hypothetical protein